MNIVISKDRSLPATEGVKGHRHRDWNIYPDHPSFHLLHKRPGGSTVACENRGTVPVLMPVHELQRFSCIADPYDTKNRAKNLLPIDSHSGPDVVEKTATEKKSFSDGRSLKL